MPHINRIRLVNVAFNENSQIYDDFGMNFLGHSATYQLTNGGGKSVLLMMLLQTVLPNTSLNKDKPLGNIFIGGKDRTSHVLIEWALDEGEHYKYLLTGFCARKRRSGDPEDNKNILNDNTLFSNSVDSFNYYHLYNEPNLYDIENIELAVNKEDKSQVTTYNGLRRYLKNIKDKGRMVDFSDIQKDYMEFIKGYNLLDTEWKIIKDINSGENNVVSYFRKNNTSRRVIENLLIKIIEDIESKDSSKGLSSNEGSKNLADTLMEIRENIKEYLSKKELMKEYKIMISFYERLQRIVLNVRDNYKNKEEVEKDIVGVFNKLHSSIDSLQQEEDVGNNLLIEIDKDIAIIEEELKLLDIRRLEIKKISLEREHLELEKQQSILRTEKEEVEDSHRFAKAQNAYIKYKKEEEEYLENNYKIKISKKDNESLYERRELFGFNMKYHLENFVSTQNNQLNDLEKNLKKLESTQELKEEDKNKLVKTIANSEAELRQLEKQKEQLKKIIGECDKFFNKKGMNNLLLFSQDRLDEIRSKLKSHKEKLVFMEEEKDKIRDEISKNKETSAAIRQLLESEKTKLKDIEDFFNGYKMKKDTIDEIFKFYNVEKDITFLKNKLESSESKLREEISERNNLKKVHEKEIEKLSSDHFVTNKDIITVKEKLEHIFKDVFLGIEILHQNKTNEQKNNILEKNSLIPYSIVLNNEDFNKLQNNRESLAIDVTSPVPIMNLEGLKNIDAIKELSFEEVLFTHGNRDYFLSKEKRELRIDELERKITILGNKQIKARDSLKLLEEYRTQVLVFEGAYSEEVISNKQKQLGEVKDTIILNKKKQKQLGNKQEELSKKVNTVDDEMQMIKNSIDNLTIELDYTQKRLDTSHELEIREKEIKKLEAEKKQADNQLELVEKELVALKSNIKRKDKEIMMLRNKLEETEKTYMKFEEYTARELLNLEFKDISSEYNAINKKLSGKLNEIENLEELRNKNKENMDSYKNIIEENEKDIDTFKSLVKNGRQLFEWDKKQLEELRSNIKKLDADIDRKTEELKEVKGKIDKLEGSIKTMCEKLDDEVIKSNQFNHLNKIDDIDNEIQLKKIDKENSSQEKIKLEEELTEVKNSINNQSKGYDALKILINENDIVCRDDIISDREDILSGDAEIYNEFSNKYSQIKDSIARNNRDFERQKKNIVSEGRDFRIREPILAIENLNLPNELSESLFMLDQLDDQTDIVNEQIKNIEETLDRLEGYQSDFVNQCMEKALWILSKLKRLTSLTRINLNGEYVNMTKLEFKDYSEEEQVRRMENYIKTIIRDIDESEEVEKLKISKMLESKKLLAQITDMEKASLKLFKVEDINGKSRYLRWERAVGSEGQSNAIYLTFAICLISFIRANASLSDSESKKVIISDNPFGSTGATYLWDPIFKILRENNVQLIAPGYDISKELLSRFSVNYLLNKGEGTEGRESIVIKDIRTEVDIDSMRYEKIEGNQQTLF